MLAIHVIAPPPRIEVALAEALAGNVVKLRSNLLPTAVLPGIREEDFYLVHNDDIRVVLTTVLGIEQVTLFHLPVGRTTPIAKNCCKLIEI